jgi:hypothetical protein
MGMLGRHRGGAARFGGLGVAVSRPRGGGGGEPATGCAEGPDAERARAVAERCVGAFGLTAGVHRARAGGHPGARRPRLGHQAGARRRRGIAELAGRSPDRRRSRSRGARTVGGGLWTFALGGFVVERRRRAGAPARARCSCATPCPASGAASAGCRRPRRAWSGRAEEEAFARLRPDPARAAQIAQLVMTSLLPALVERDLGEFGAALSAIQRLVGDAFAAGRGTFHRGRRAGRGAARPRSGGRRPDLVGTGGLRDRGSEEEGASLRRGWSPSSAWGRVEVVGFDNEGARVRVQAIEGWEARDEVLDVVDAARRR